MPGNGGNNNDIAMEEGKLAAADGKPSSANPYPDEADEHGYWEAGYNYVEETDDDGDLIEE